MKPSDEGKKVPGKKSTTRTPKKRRQATKESPGTDQETKNETTEVNEKFTLYTDKRKFSFSQNHKDQHDADYVYKPGKKSSNKRASNDQTPTNAKRKKRSSYIYSKSQQNEPHECFFFLGVSESKENQEKSMFADEQKHNDEEIVKVNEIKSDNIIQDAN